MIGIILQARTGSTRLPRKVLMEIMDGVSILEYLVSNLSNVKKANKLIVATTTSQKDDELVKLLKYKKIYYFRGSETDVRDRYLKAAVKYNIETIIRIPADNPFILPYLVDEVIEKWSSVDVDYLSTTLSETLPVGMHIEIFSVNALRKSMTVCMDDISKEHVTPCIYNNDELFSLFDYKLSGLNYSKYRLTVDYIEDLEFARLLAERVPSLSNLDLSSLISFIDSEPSLYTINSRHKKRQTIIIT